MDKKSKIFFLVFFLLIMGSVAVTYYRIIVKRDYIISAQQECDPALEACFVYVCDPESDEECFALPEEEQTTYYKIINKNAKNIPICDPSKNECPEELTCEPEEEECEITLCDADNVPEGEECNDPTVYLEENPPEESDSGEECAVDDVMEEDVELSDINFPLNPEPDKGEAGEGGQCEAIDSSAEELSDIKDQTNINSGSNTEEDLTPQLY